MRFVTIGGYGFTESSFIRALKQAGVDTFVDVRQRRGMRGSQYAFLNSRRLQEAVASAGINYVHALELAPTPGVRAAQKEDDSARRISKRDRDALSQAFIEKYRSEVLSKFNPTSLWGAMSNARVVALFCVEGRPAACHRSLAAEHLWRVFGSNRPVEHLRP